MAGRKSLLLIEEDQRSRDFVRGALSRLGFEVVVAQSGVEGVGRFAPGLFSLVITDLHLPDMGGLEVLRKIKHLSPDTAVVVLASDSEVSDVVQALRLGASDYLLKPCRTPRSSTTPSVALPMPKPWSCRTASTGKSWSGATANCATT
ncbi:response regulator [Microbulbifer taiwanensis]|uniref:response regulator n=1 Tax=Microbulbifer taiwanensis TaxID=986746 RepID=UPI00361CF348